MKNAANKEETEPKPLNCREQLNKRLIFCYPLEFVLFLFCSSVFDVIYVFVTAITQFILISL